MTGRAQGVAKKGPLLAQGWGCHSCDLLGGQNDRGEWAFSPLTPRFPTHWLFLAWNALLPS